MASAIQFGPVIFPDPSILNIFLLAISWAQGLAFNDEMSGKKNMPYGKFSHGVEAASKVSGRTGMAIIYGLSVVAGAAGVAYFLPQAQEAAAAAGTSTDFVSLLLSSRPLLMATLYFLHFLKRELESLFLQRFSGMTPTATVTNITLGYAAFLVAALYMVAQVPSEMYAAGPQLFGVPAAVAVGGAMFVVGQLGNGYHHWLLAQLRSGGGEAAKQYKVPQGGLFPLVTCPHYFFELITWWGIVVVSQHIFTAGVATGMTLYLVGRSVAAKQWYVAKMEDFPKERRYLVPYLF